MSDTTSHTPRDELGETCPLCGANEAGHYLHADARDYSHCPVCRLIFVPPGFWPAPEAEKARYEQHQNSASDEGYTSFLKQLSEPLIRLLPKGARGLDFGAGPASDGHPVLCELFQAQGIKCLPYDPYFFPETPDGPFDFIAASETFEHLRHPREEIGRIYENLKPGGLLGVMTAFWEEALFANNWHYRRDFTHLCFYRLETFAWIQENFGFACRWTDERRVIILEKL